MAGSPRLVYVVTAGLSARTLLRGQLAFMRSRGYDVTVIADGADDLDAVARAEGVRVVPLSMAREVRPLQDARSLWELVKTLRELEPDIVNAGTMKAGLLGMMAAFVTRAPVRIYVLRGLRLEGLTGAPRAILLACEAVASACAHRVLCVSPSLRKEYERLGVTPASKLRVLLEGSSNGIDTSRFEPTEERLRAAVANRQRLGIPPTAKVVGFVGRFTHDKGIEDLIRAFEQVRTRVAGAVLLLVGSRDATDPVSPECQAALETSSDIKQTGFVSDVASWYPVMDVLVLPSLREGFPNVPLEAAVASVPTVAYAATGTVDAVVSGKTGMVVPAHDWTALADAIVEYLTKPELCERHGANARERAITMFRSEAIWTAIANEYDELSKSRRR